MDAYVGWSAVQENNEQVNARRKKLKAYKGYLKDIIESSNARVDEVEEARNALAQIEILDGCYSKAYLDSGYAYDAGSSRAMRDWAFDTWQENERAREGSTLKDGIESEIRMEVTLRHAEDCLREINQTFNDVVMRRIFDAVHFSSIGSMVQEDLSYEYEGMMDDHGDHDL
jgi:hypothetical protein